MKVIALNGSPKPKGNTYYALKTVCDGLEAEGIESEIINVGALEIRGCISCGRCKDGYCILNSADLTAIVNRIYEADGLIIGSPVYYAGVAGTFKSFLDRLFYASHNHLRHKVGAALAIPRRSGGISTFDELNHYLLISEMLVTPSYYWNVLHGGAPGEVLKDSEGMSILNNLAKNMSWLIKMKAATQDTLPAPEPYPRAWTNFIR
ncbi:MAG TPA: flavodoxin family protein [Mobilitalea sp.]|nr:flavodoxin family protein [Mobilitalea sp.]